MNTLVAASRALCSPLKLSAMVQACFFVRKGRKERKESETRVSHESMRPVGKGLFDLRWLSFASFAFFAEKIAFQIFGDGGVSRSGHRRPLRSRS